MRIAVLVPAPDYPEPWEWAFDAEAEALSAEGLEVTAVPWTAPDDLSGFDLILPLVAWGYHLRFDAWLSLLDRFEKARLPVVNPPALLRWSSDKSYLAELCQAGVPTVPSLVVEQLTDQELNAARAELESDRLVVKPLVSASAHGTYLLEAGDRVPQGALGRRMLVQPLMEAICLDGEYSLMLFDGVCSHAVVKRPADGDFRVQPHLGGVTTSCNPPEGAEQLALAALAAAPAPSTYARVDMVRGPEGDLRIMELELVEPALFLHLAPQAGKAFARSVRKAAESAQEEPLAQG